MNIGTCSLFGVLDNVFAILFSKGVYRQAKVYHRDGELYAGHGSGFVKLFAQNTTSHPNVAWKELSADSRITFGRNAKPLLSLPPSVELTALPAGAAS